MKKLLVLVAFICLGLNGFSQEPSLPNGNFESWSQKPNWGYYEPNGGFFHTLNILDTVPTSAGVSVYRCGDTVHRGSYSARCITRLMVIAFPLVVTIPGVIGTLKINWIKSAAVLGEKFNWTTKPERFQGWYQSYPLSGDTTAAIILLSKWNSSTHKRDTIAHNRLVFHGTVNTWTQFDAAINYWNTTTMPDSITVLLLSCAGYSASNMMGSVGTPGSQAYFDDVTITNVAGIEYVFQPSVDVKISPNPASANINVKLDKVMKDGSFEIYDGLGRKTGQFEMKELSAQINVSNLSPGVYYYRFRNAGEVVNTGSFIVSR
ncbi:MAG: T9SS type A sorting domain-containing protein [Bacteroidetes bacterium]|nr:T9SS type A sorting domain-containing protein [Bacteroidota bacterium]